VAATASLVLPGVDARAEAAPIEAEEMEDTDPVEEIEGASVCVSTLPKESP
jgi:hypothetical protein